MKEEKNEVHESFGLLNFSRTSSSGNGVSLFGSSIKHNNTIVLKISSAEINRHLNKNWYHGRKTLIEVEMSPNQFSDAITSLNMGEGVPVTLKYVNGKELEKCPQVLLREQVQNEFKDHINEISEKLKELISESKELLTKKGTLKIKEKEELLSIIGRISTEVIQNTPFIQKQFNISIDRTVIEAKGEVEAFVSNMVTKLGLESLKDKLVLLQTDDQPNLKIENKE